MSQPCLSIGEVARRSGLASSALRYYEAQGLLSSARSAGGQRQYRRDVLRRLGFIRVAQSVGLSLEQIRQALATLPGDRTPTLQDWQQLSGQWQALLQQRIVQLNALHDTLTACIGCGCLSLDKCALYNPQDCAAQNGAGPRFLLADAG